MKRHYYIYGLILLAGLVSCRRTEPDPENPFTDRQILVSAGPGTKAILDGATAMDHSGTSSTIYDYLSDFEGTIKVDGGEPHTYTAEESFKYFDDLISYPGGEGAWTYGSGNSYRWTRTGTHTFFGWMTTDGDSGLTTQGFFGAAPAFDETTRILTLPSKTLTTTSDQYDFLYSESRSVAAAEAGDSPVPLQYKHLFSALKLQVQNVSDNTVVVTDIQTAYFNNTKTALVNFNDGTVSYSAVSAQNFVPSFPERTLAKNDSFYLWGNDYKLIWPQTPEEIAQARLLVSYYLQDDPSNVIQSTIELKDVRVNGRLLTETGIEAGKKYSFLLQFKNGSIDLDLYVLDWYYTEYTWDFSETTISAQTGQNIPFEGILWLYHQDGTTITKDDDRKLIMLNSQEVIRGEFYIASPYIGRWQLSMFPMDAAQYFVITPSSGNITREMVENEYGKVSFEVRANPDVDAPTSTQTAHFNISIYFGNEWHDANSEFNRKDFRLVRNP